VIAANEGIRALCWIRNDLIEISLTFLKPNVFEENANLIFGEGT